MPKNLIEREIPVAGTLTKEQLKGISQTSCGVLKIMGLQIQCVHSYVKELIYEFVKQGDVPANFVIKIVTIIDPITSE